MINFIVPGNEPYFIPRGSTGCLLMHGFTAMPEETRLLGDDLAARGFSVYGVRFAGHATHPGDLIHTRWTDWLQNVEDGLALISQVCSKRVLIGQSMGGAVALVAAARYAVDAVVALSTPYSGPRAIPIAERIRILLHPTIDKKVARFPKEHPLYHRRELNYPAYPEFPARIFYELNGLIGEMADSLPRVKVPALLIHSRDDQSVPFASLQAIYERLGSARKEMLALDGMDHSLVRDPQRQVVFDAISTFLQKSA